MTAGRQETGLGAEPYPCPNEFIMSRSVSPVLAATEDSDDLHRDVLNIAWAFETVFGASYQSFVSMLQDLGLRSAAMVHAGEEARHSTVLARMINPEETFAPSFFGEPEEKDAAGFPVPYAIPSVFGRLSGVELVVGKILPYVGIGYVQMSLVLLLGRLVFDVPLVGSLELLFALAFVFIASNLALGLFFSTLAKTQQQAMQMSFFFLLPNILLSGFMFPFEAMPRPAQILAEVLPLTHFLRIVRGITLKNSHFGDVQAELYWLCAILAALVVAASLRFTKKLA